MITTYRIEDITDMEEFLNNLYIGLKHYEKVDHNVKIKIKHTMDTITVTILKLEDGQLN